MCNYSLELGRELVFMAIAFKSSCFLQLNKPQTRFAVSFSCNKPVTISFKRRFTPVAVIKTMETIGLSETFSRLKKQGKVSVLVLPPLQIMQKSFFRFIEQLMYLVCIVMYYTYCFNYSMFFIFSNE
jgi:hypothetical protein